MSDLDKQLMNADSFDELYLAYYPAMLSYARMFLRDQWAEDVVQDVFFNIWKNRHRISTDDPLYKYLLKAVVVRFADRPNGVRLLRSGQESDPCQNL